MLGDPPGSQAEEEGRGKVKMESHHPSRQVLLPRGPSGCALPAPGCASPTQSQPSSPEGVAFTTAQDSDCLLDGASEARLLLLLRRNLGSAFLGTNTASKDAKEAHTGLFFWHSRGTCLRENSLSALFPPIVTIKTSAQAQAKGGT